MRLANAVHQLLMGRRTSRANGDLVFMMMEIMLVAVHVTIVAVLIAAEVFFGVAFWHWRGEEKRRDLRRCK
jgi:hypothetical protein